MAAFSVIALGAAAAPAWAVDQFFGEDVHPAGNDAPLANHPNADAARASFLAALSAYSVDDLEGQSENGTIPLQWTALTGSATGDGPTSVGVQNTPSSGQNPVDGTNYIRLNPDGDPVGVRINFSTPQRAFGCYATDIADSSLPTGVVVRLILHRGTGPDTNADFESIAHGGPGGNVHFFGVIDRTADFTGVTVRFVSADPDDFAVDGLIVGTPGPSGPPPTVATIDSYFLPRSVTFHRGTPLSKKPDPGFLEIDGFFDTGSQGGDLTQAASVAFGSYAVSIPAGGLVYDTKKKRFQYLSGPLDFRIVPSRDGSSRARFKVTITGDPAQHVSTGENLTISYQGGGIDAIGTVGLDDNGNYRLGRKRGALVAPDLVFYRLNGKTAGAGKDSFLIKAGMAAGGYLPESAPDVTIQITGAIDQTISGGSFTKKGHRFVYTSKGPGVTKVDLDFDRERAEFHCAKASIGTYANGPVPFEIRIVVGGTDRTLRVRAFNDTKKKTIRY